MKSPVLFSVPHHGCQLQECKHEWDNDIHYQITNASRIIHPRMRTGAAIELKKAGLNMCRVSSSRVRDRGLSLGRKMNTLWISGLCCLLLLGGALGKTKEEWKSRIIYQVYT